ncbi:MAG: zinc ribbon domain-containing protein [Oceanipulchritudo sp.]
MPGMVPDWLQQLLILQDRDSRCDTIQRQLESIPGQIAAEEENIRQLDQRLRDLSEEVKQLEVRRMDIEGEVEQAEAAILKYKTQQMQVKKNEEYTALEHEIARMQEKISDLEDAELRILEEADLKQEQLVGAKKTIGQERATLEAHIDRLRQNHKSYSAELEDARKQVEECEAAIDPGILQQYRYVKGQVKRPPLVVPLEEGKCQGCHLRVSGEVDSLARKGTELVRCDSCGRILYFDR